MRRLALHPTAVAIVRATTRFLLWGAAVIALAILVLTILLEPLGIHYLLRGNTVPNNAILLSILKAMYHNSRSFIQYEEDCARYDDELGYTLRPGRCQFTNVEFSVPVEVNSEGLRDDETSLREPTVIVLGDSHAMGWGVPGDEIFPAILEEETGVKVLNAAISSYATARELLLLERIDRRALRLVILQYCDNDFKENEHFVRTGSPLLHLNRTTYERIVDDVQHGQGYYFGRYVLRMLRVQVLRRIQRLFLGEQAIPNPTGPTPKAQYAREEASHFLTILDRLGESIAATPIILLEIDAYGVHDNEFLSAVEHRQALGLANRFHIIPLDLSDHLTDRHFFRLDDHLNPDGHREVAKRLLPLVLALVNERSSFVEVEQIVSARRMSAKGTTDNHQDN